MYDDHSKCSEKICESKYFHKNLAALPCPKGSFAPVRVHGGADGARGGLRGGRAVCRAASAPGPSGVPGAAPAGGGGVRLPARRGGASGPVAFPCDEDRLRDIVRSLSSSSMERRSFRRRRGESRPLLQGVNQVQEKLVSWWIETMVSAPWHRTTMEKGSAQVLARATAYCMPGRGKKAKAERAPAAARGREVVLRSCVMPDGGHIAR
jgi:hypothetical protein